MYPYNTDVKCKILIMKLMTGQCTLDSSNSEDSCFLQLHFRYLFLFDIIPSYRLMIRCTLTGALSRCSCRAWVQPPSQFSPSYHRRMASRWSNYRYSLLLTCIGTCGMILVDPGRTPLRMFWLCSAGATVLSRWRLYWRLKLLTVGADTRVADPHHVQCCGAGCGSN